MNFLGIDVRGLELDPWFLFGRALYATAFVFWVARIWGGRRTGGVWGPVALAVLWWGVVTFPLQRLYGLNNPSDRLRNLWWCATAAAGNPPWESGIVGRWSLEPFWSLLVSLLALRDPARVLAVYPFLPVLGLALTGATLAMALRAQPGEDREDGGVALRGLFAAFFLLLAVTAPFDFTGHFRNFWARHFLLKPNHALGLALVPLAVHAVSRPLSWRRAAGASALLGLLAWAFLVDFVLFCWCLGIYALLLRAHRRKEELHGLARVGLMLAVVGAVGIVPYLVYLAPSLPALLGLVGAGDRPPAGQAPLLMATLDLGPVFALALWGAWQGLRRARPWDLAWLAVLLGALSAWTIEAVLYPLGGARVTDEVYFFVLFAVAVHAGIGAADLVRRLGLAASPPFALARVAAWRAWAGLLLLAWVPFTLPWWWNAALMDAHFNVALQPLPPEMVAVADGLRRHTAGTDVVLAGEEAAGWIPALSGRRVLRIDLDTPGNPGYERERTILVPTDLAAARDTLAALGVQVVVADASLLREHGLAARELDQHPLLAKLFETAHTHVYVVRARGRDNKRS